ncbi:MAG TPA: hypothetical protein VF077_13100 [Nitrospiraceae bacterium]
MNLALLIAVVIICPCPQPPSGYDCYVLAPATLTNRVAFALSVVPESHPTHLSLSHWATNGVTYEVQYKRLLSDTQWLAYCRVIMTNTDTLTTHFPMQCGAAFVRVCRN